MKLRVQQTIVNDNYTFIFSIDQDSISSDDAALFAKYGDQPINFGGSFVDDASATFVLPDIYFNLPSDFPVKQTFTAVSPSVFATNTTNRLLVYRTAINTLISTTITNLRATADTFTGEFITNI